MSVSEELSVFIENNYDAFSLLAFILPHRHVGLGQQTTSHLSTSTADIELIIGIIVFCVKRKEISHLASPTLKITTINNNHIHR